MKNKNIGWLVACAGIAASVLLGGAALGQQPAENLGKPQPTIRDLIEKIEQQNRILEHQQKRLAEQEKRLGVQRNFGAAARRAKTAPSGSGGAARHRNASDGGSGRQPRRGERNSYVKH